MRDRHAGTRDAGLQRQRLGRPQEQAGPRFDGSEIAIAPAHAVHHVEDHAEDRKHHGDSRQSECCPQLVAFDLADQLIAECRAHDCGQTEPRGGFIAECGPQLSQIGSQVGCVGVAFLFVLGKRAADDLFEFGRQAALALTKRPWFPL